MKSLIPVYLIALTSCSAIPPAHHSITDFAFPWSEKPAPATARWFHPQSGRFQAESVPLQTTLSPPETDTPSDWLLLIEAR